MRALSIRQPFAELILRGVKTVEYRSRPTRIVGQRFWIYASRQPAGRQMAAGARRGAGEPPAIWSRDLAVPGEALPAWMVELAEQVRLIEPGALLPTGVIVGSAIIERCEPVATGSLASHPSTYAWHLAGVERMATPRVPTGHPQPVWFRPF